MTMPSNLLANPAVGLCRAGVRAVVLLVTATALTTPVVDAQEPVRQQQPAHSQPATAERDAALKGFTDRVNAYVDMKKKLEQGLPQMKPGAVTTGAAETHESVLATRLRETRAAAKPGDVFGDAVPIFRQIIAQDSKTRGVADAFASMEEVPAKSPPAVNAAYPEKAALATVPPLILVNLPRLPDGLEYRFMGRDLILRDRNANLVVDFIVGAVPAVRK